MKILGVIPAAGEGKRWGGYFKELLPIENNSYLIDRTIMSMLYGGADEVVIITNTEKISAHAKHLENFPNIYSFKIQDGKNDLWSAIYTGLLVDADYYLFAMPDTYYHEDNFRNIDFKSDLYLGLFDTTEIKRFGILFGNERIVDKSLHCGFGKTFKAWGTLVWSKKVRDYWLDNCIDVKHYSNALNMAMKEFGFSTFDMPFYYDMATFLDYKNLIEITK